MDSAVEHPTTTWEAMPTGNVFYRRLQLYSIPGKLPDLNDFVVAGCRNGGPIGTCALFVATYAKWPIVLQRSCVTVQR